MIFDNIGSTHMRLIAVAALVLLGSRLGEEMALAQSSNNCNKCRDQQRACMSNYSAKTCKAEYDLCIKGCNKK